MAEFTTEIKRELEAPLSSAHVTQRKQAGITLDYIEGWWAIAEANRIFGFDGWTRETIDMRQLRDPEQVNGKWRVGFIAKVKVTAIGTAREGTGYGSGIAGDLGDAIESAVKEAETDAMKRALMTFGNPFGLALYDKSRANVSQPEFTPAEPRTQAKPKAKARADYSDFETLIRSAANLKTLQDIWENRIPWGEIPEDWKPLLVDEKDSRIVDLKQEEHDRKNGKSPNDSLDELLEGQPA